METEDLDGLAIFSLIAGVASLVIVLFGWGARLDGVGLLGGVAAVYAGVRVLRGTAELKKLAIAGTVTGTIAVAAAIVNMITRAVYAVWQFFF